MDSPELKSRYIVVGQGICLVGVIVILFGTYVSRYYGWAYSADQVLTIVATTILLMGLVWLGTIVLMRQHLETWEQQFDELHRRYIELQRDLELVREKWGHSRDQDRS